MRNRTGAIAEHLYLYVAGMNEQTLDVERTIAEGRLRLGRAALEGGRKLGGIRHRAHAAAAATGDRLDHDGTTRTEVGEEGLRVGERRRTIGAGDDIDTMGGSKAARGGLVAEQVERIR